MTYCADGLNPWQLLEPGSVTDYPNLTALHQVVRPVVRIIGDGVPGVGGSAVHLSAEVPTTFVTARHVFQQTLANKALNAKPRDLYVAWTPPPVDGVLSEKSTGRLVQVLHYEHHSSADVASLSTARPPSGYLVGDTFPVGLRMPAVGEKVTHIGYPEGSFTGGGPVDDECVQTLGLVLTSVLRVSVGVVVSVQVEREDIDPDNTRAAPGFYTDAVTVDGMSGGPVVDEGGVLIGFTSRSSGSGFSGWATYVALAGDMLGMHTRVPTQAAGSGLGYAEVPIESLLAAGKTQYETGPSFSIVDGVPSYSDLGDS